MTEALTTETDPLITSPPTFSPRPAPSSLPEPQLTHTDSSDLVAVTKGQTTPVSAPAQLRSDSGGSESSTGEISSKTEEKYHLLASEAGGQAETVNTHTLSRTKRGAQRDLRFVFR